MGSRCAVGRLRPDPGGDGPPLAKRDSDPYELSVSQAARDQDVALRHLYESFPYPRVVGSLDDFKSGRRQPTWNPKTSFPVFFPESEARDDLDILIAGCGTHLAPIFAATMPNSRVVAIDISSTSLKISQELATSEGLENVEHHRLPLEEVASLERSFDFVCCTGVVHHLADPAAGLRALGKVLRPEGAMMIMVYARYGRQGVYMLQELAQRLGLPTNELSAAKLQKLLALLPPRHPFRLVYADGGARISLEEVMDMVLNPRDRSYRVQDVRTLVEDAGLGFHRWLGNAEYRPEMTSLGPAGLARELSDDPWERAAAAELSLGSLIKHSFVVTHPQRASAETLFAGDGIRDAIPSLSAHLRIEHAGANLVATNDGHQTAVPTVAPVGELAALLKAIDGRSVGKLAASLPKGALEAYRQLYHADVIQLSLA